MKPIYSRIVYLTCFASSFCFRSLWLCFLTLTNSIFHFILRRLNFKFINVFLLFLLGNGHGRLNSIVGLFQFGEYIIRFLDKIFDFVSNYMQVLVNF